MNPAPPVTSSRLGMRVMVRLSLGRRSPAVARVYRSRAGLSQRPRRRPILRVMTADRGPIEVTVEIPSGSRNKYEYDHVNHRFVLDRILYSSVHYPCDYGFLEGTLADDGDPLDVLVVISEPTFPGCIVRARPVGVLDMRDDKGHDYKVLAVAADDPRWDETLVMGDLSPHRLREIENFFQIYKELEGRRVDVFGWLGPDDAWRIIDEASRAGGQS
jgi:inorganic pyrophosphatase